MAAIINYDNYEGQDIYNDGDIEAIALEKLKNNTMKDEEITERLDMFFLFTPIRKNILSWYNFKENADILEIGVGTGTITELLCKRARSVTAIDASKRRCEIAYERHKNNENLEIIVGNFNKIKFKKKYDYVVMVGILEYANIFKSGAKNPYKEMLKDIKEVLKEDGSLLLAIENRLGIKYLAGANEDHLAIPFSGIEGYHSTNKIKTFSKEELKELLLESGFLFNRFYYPFPDYKMPSVIYSDDYDIPRGMFKKFPIFNQDEGRYVFNYKRVLDTLVDNKIFGLMSNSFLVECNINNKYTEQAIYAKYNNDRNREFQCITKIYNDRIEKIPMYEESKKHLDNLYETHKKLRENNYKACDIIKNDDGKYIIEKIDGKLMTELIYEKIKDNDKEGVEKLIDDFVKLTHGMSIEDENANRIMKIGLLDLNLSNVIINNNKELILIDQEWIINCKVEMKYVIYFAIKILYEQVYDIEKIIDFEYLISKYNISQEEINNFNNYSKKYFFHEMQAFDSKIYKLLFSRSNINIIDITEEDRQNNINFKLERDVVQAELNKTEWERQKLEARNRELESLKTPLYIRIKRKIGKVLK